MTTKELMSLESIKAWETNLVDYSGDFILKEQLAKLCETARAAHSCAADAEGLLQSVRDANEACNELEKENQKLRIAKEDSKVILKGFTAALQMAQNENEKLREALNTDYTATELEQKVIDLLEDNKNLDYENKGLRDNAIEGLERINVELKKDAERLNWLEINSKTCTVYMNGTKRFFPNGTSAHLYGTTYREAIDNAIAAEKENDK